MKKTIVVTLILAMLLACVMPMSISAEAEAQPISTVEEFEAMSATGNYYLTGDIDFQGKTYDKGYILADFSGKLDGKGYAIHNFSITGSDGAGVAIFTTVCAAGAATIQNLQIGKNGANVQLTLVEAAVASNVAALATKQASGNHLLTVDNVDIYADIHTCRIMANANIAGFISSAHNLSLTNSTMHGSVTGWVAGKTNNTAGLVGEIRTAGGIIENCINYADVTLYYNDTIRGAGIVAYINPDDGCTGTVKDCVNFGTVTDVDMTFDGYRTIRYGLFAGIVSDIQHAGDGVIDSCVNFGEIKDVTVTNTLKLVGASGILTWTTTANTVQNCVNYGKVSSISYNANGIVSCDQSNGALTLTNNVDKSADVTATPALDVATHGVQESEAADGKFNVRFLGTVNTLELDSVGFEITVYYNDSEGNAKTKTYEQSCAKVYKTVIAKAENGLALEETAENLGGEYIYALSILGVPAEADNGNVTFVYRAVAKDGDTTVYGSTVACSYRNGEFLYCSYVG